MQSFLFCLLVLQLTEASVWGSVWRQRAEELKMKYLWGMYKPTLLYEFRQNQVDAEHFGVFYSNATHESRYRTLAGSPCVEGYEQDARCRVQQLDENPEQRYVYAVGQHPRKYYTFHNGFDYYSSLMSDDHNNLNLSMKTLKVAAQQWVSFINWTPSNQDGKRG